MITRQWSTLDYVRSSANYLKTKIECDGDVIDYLQLCDEEVVEQPQPRAGP